jgi:hypothetical protein
MQGETNLKFACAIRFDGLFWSNFVPGLIAI